jgi:hypothetical protein
MASIKKNPSLVIHSVSLSPDTEAILHRLSSDASDFIGRAISESAIVRALLRRTEQQGPHEAGALFSLVEEELNSGMKWGKKQGKGAVAKRP